GYTDFGNNGNNFQEQQFQGAQDVYENNRYPPIDNRPLNNGKNLGPGYSQKPEPLQDYNITSPNYSSPPLEVYPPSPGKQPYQEGLAVPLGPNSSQPEIQQQYSPDYPNYPNYNNYNSPMQAPLYNPQMQTPYGHELPPEPPHNYHNQFSKPDHFPSSTYNLNQTQPYSRSQFNTKNTTYTSNEPQPPINYSNYSQSQNTTYTSNDPYPPKNYSPPLNNTYTPNDPRPPKNYAPPQNIEITSYTSSDSRAPKNYSPTLNTSYTSNDPHPPKNYSPPLNTSSDPRPPKDYTPALKKSYTSNDPLPPKHYSPPSNTSSNGPRPPKNYSPSQNTNSKDNYSPPSQPAIEAPTYVGGNKRERIMQKNNRCCNCSICGCIQCTCTLVALLIGVVFIIVGIGLFTLSKELPSVCGPSCDPSQVTNSTNSTTSAIPGNFTNTINQAVNNGSSE
ncbi:7563_t:CDS:1, partial [Dentiscutata erythropus]